MRKCSLNFRVTISSPLVADCLENNNAVQVQEGRSTLIFRDTRSIYDDGGCESTIRSPLGTMLQLLVTGRDRHFFDGYIDVEEQTAKLWLPSE